MNITGAGDVLPTLTTCYAIDNGKSSGPTFDSEAEALEQPEHVHLGHPVLRLYVDAAGRIVHTERVDDA